MIYDRIVLGAIDAATVQPGLVVGQGAGLIAFGIPQLLEALVNAARDAILGAMRDHAQEQQLYEDQHHNRDDILHNEDSDLVQVFEVGVSGTYKEQTPGRLVCRRQAAKDGNDDYDDAQAND